MTVKERVSLVERLRFFATQTTVSFPGYLADAADEIERLEQRYASLLKRFESACGEYTAARSRIMDLEDALRAHETSAVTMPDICGEHGPISAEECALWLDAKYRRHHELEDRASAMWLRFLSARVQYTAHEPPDVFEAFERWRKSRDGNPMAFYDERRMAFQAGWYARNRAAPPPPDDTPDPRAVLWKAAEPPPAIRGHWCLRPGCELETAHSHSEFANSERPPEPPPACTRCAELEQANVGLAQDIEDLKAGQGQTYWRRMANRAEEQLADAVARIDELEESTPPPTVRMIWDAYAEGGLWKCGREGCGATYSSPPWSREAASKDHAGKCRAQTPVVWCSEMHDFGGNTACPACGWKLK